MRGFDTETVNRSGHGWACLLVDSDGRTLEFPETLDAIFRFLVRDHHGTTRYVAWNMDFDARAVIHEKFVPYPVLERLDYHGTAGAPGGIQVSYVPRKFLRLARGRDAVEVYDLAQFYGLRLKDAAAKFLPGRPGKQEIPESWYGEMDRCLKDARRGRVLDYARRDAALLPELFERVRAQFEKLGVHPRRWLSPGSLAVRYFADDLATIPQIPGYWAEAFRRSFYGGRIEVGGLGELRGPLRLYDINSAYPWAAAALPRLAGLRPHHSKAGEWAYSPATIYGAYHVRADVPASWAWGPLAMRDGSDLEVLYPVGRFRTWCGRAGLETLRAWNIPHDVLEAYEYDALAPAPLQFPKIPELYQARRNPEINIAAKLTLNSLYGKLAETKTRRRVTVDFDRRGIWHGFQKSRTWEIYGKFACFPLAAAITERVRLRIWDILNAGGAFAAMTDAVLTRRELPTGHALGEWGLKMTVDRARLFGCGRYHLEGRDKDGGSVSEFKFRGFSTDAENLALLENAGPSARVSDFRARSLTEYVRDGGRGDLNVLKTIKLKFDLGDKKRYFPIMPGKIAELSRSWFNSDPWIFKQKGEKCPTQSKN